MHKFASTFLMLLIWLTCAAGQAVAQDRYVGLGQHEMAKMNYAKAAAYFEAAFKRMPTYAAAEGNSRAYLGLRNYQQAAKWHAQALQFPTAGTPIRFRYGRVLQMLGHQEAAALQFDSCALALPDESRFRDLARFARMAATAVADSNWRVQPLGLNSKASDFGPCIFADGLLFASQRNNSVVGVTHTSPATGGFLADLYFAKAKDTLRFSRPDLLPGSLNSPLHEGPACLAADSLSLLFVRSRRTSAQQAREGLSASSDIWRTALVDGKWQAPALLPFPETVANFTDPFLLPDGQTLLFAAEIAGGLGGLDLYRASLRDGQWSAPQNLGSGVNTPGNDRSPFLAADGSLWFASDGWPGYGGLDIFHAAATAGSWSRPENPGLPLNSYLDDYDLIFAAEGSYGYFATNRRNGGWDDDIFAFSFSGTRQIVCQVQKSNSYCYNLYEADTPDPLPGTLFYNWRLGDGTTAEGGTVDHCFPGPGDYHIQLEVMDSLTGEPVFEQANYILEIRDEVQAFITSPDSVQTGLSQSFSAENSWFPGFRPSRYTWDFGDGFGGNGPVIDHAFANPGNYDIQLLVDGSDSLDPGRDHYCVTRTLTVLNVLPAPIPPIATTSPKPSINPSPRPANGTDFRIQLGVAPVGFDSLLQPYRDIPGVETVRDGTTNRFVLSENLSLEDAFAQLPEARKMGFSNPTILVFRDDKLLPHQPFLDNWLPSDGLEQAIVKGVIVDRFDVPKSGTIVWENLTTGEVALETKSDPADGGFIQALPKDVFYGYYVDLEGYYSISRNLDLRDYQGVLVIMDSIEVYAIEEMVREHLPVRINNLFFDFDSDRIRKESHRELYRLVRFLLEHPQMKIEIGGHCDRVGTPQYNLDLSRRRAQAVKRFLVLSGCNVDLIQSRGYGETVPAKPNGRHYDYQANRRVEFSILSLK